MLGLILSVQTLENRIEVTLIEGNFRGAASSYCVSISVIPGLAIAVSIWITIYIVYDTVQEQFNCVITIDSCRSALEQDKRICVVVNEEGESWDYPD